MLPQIDQSNNLEPQVPLETGTYFSDLVTSNPAASDPLSTADDHMRLIKAVLVNTFPGLGAPLTRSPGGIILPTDGSSSAPAIAFTSEPTLGFYRSAAGVLQFVGGLLKGVLPVGSIHHFLAAPAGLGTEYLELDGSAYNNTDFPALAAHLGQGGTFFRLPDAKTTGRFLRSRTASVPAGTQQTNQNLSHDHPYSGNTGGQSNGHTHNGSGTTGGMNRNNPHNHTINTNSVAGNFNNNGGGGGSFSAIASTTATISSTDIDHEHAFSFTTGDVSTDHHHGFSGTTSASGGSEARPEALSCIVCIKT